MDDLISRQAAIEVIKNYCENECDIAEGNWCPDCQYEQFVKLLEELPSAEPPYNPDEWCHDCKEYDQERHCCPRFNRVIKQTKEDFEAQNEIIHCKDCRNHGTAICRIWSRYGTINTPDFGFCYWAERKETDESD